MSEILEFLGFEFSARRHRPRQWNGAIPEAPNPRSSPEPNPEIAAYHLQLLGALTPEHADRARERLFERSLLATEHLNKNANNYRALKARAYLNLGMRPAALELLNSPKTPTEKGLVATLNGNLTELTELLTEIEPQADRLLALVDVYRLKVDYGLYDSQMAIAEARAVSPPSGWHELIDRHFIDADMWQTPRNKAIKQRLDREFPVDGFDLKAGLDGAVILGMTDNDKFAAELSVGQHIEKLMDRSPELWCCSPLTYHPKTSDYLNVLESTAQANLIRRIEKMTYVQDTPEAALELLDITDLLYYEHPHFALQRASAQLRRSNSASPDIAATLRKAAFKHAANSFYWEQGQTETARRAWGLVGLTRQLPNHGLDIENIYTGDLPYREGYPLRRISRRSGPGVVDQTLSDEQKLERYIAFATSDFDPIKTQFEYARKRGNLNVTRRLELELANRFHGAPERYLWLSAESRNAGNDDAADRHLRKGIEVHPRHWDFYSQLGESLVERGEIESANKVFNSYPPFNDRDLNRVELSNEAYLAGSLFYWRGFLDEARPFYELSAGLQTGSSGSMTSAIRLALIDKDYASAVTGSLNRANRYNSSHAYRDYLSLLFMLGYADEAWQGFDLLAAQQTQPHIWEAAFVGHRQGNYEDVEIVAWTQRDHLQRNRASARSANRYLLRAAIVDRVPSDTMIEAIAQYVGPYWILEDDLHNLSSSDSRTWGRASPAKHTGEGWGKFIEIDSPALYIAKAYRAIQDEQYETAWSLLEEFAHYHDRLASQSLGVVLPYYAIAGIKAGKTTAVTTMLNRIEERSQTFDYWLARAIEWGMTSDKQGALRALDRAMGKRPFTEQRSMFPEYEYAEVCEWLWYQTAEPEYRERVIHWAQANQRLQPWSAWPYAMIATLSEKQAERRHALTSALYLDANSKRLRELPDNERTMAAPADPKSSPFLYTPPSADAETSL